MSAVAIIPARGGSKRIPGKNGKLFVGKPIITYSIDVAKRSNLFERVIVSTDSNEIAEIAEKYGAEVPFVRPDYLSDDYTVTDDVFLHALSWLKENDKSFEYACCIYATCPFLQVKYLKLGLETLKKEKSTSAFSVTTFPYPIFRALKINNNDRLEMIWHEHLKTRSQDLPEVFHDAGQFYWVRVDKYLEKKLIMSDDAFPVVIPRSLVQDIDTIEDWEYAEDMYRLNYSG